MFKLKVGDRVKVKVPIAIFKHRKTLIGNITRIDGFYIYVKPLWSKHILELYGWELEKLNKENK